MNKGNGFFLWFLILTPALTMAPDAEGDDATRQRFLAEYPAASKKLQDFYSQIRMVAKHKKPLVKRFDEPPKFRAVEWKTGEWEYLANATLHRLDTYSDDSGSIRSIVATPELSFRVMRDPGASRFRVFRMGEPSPEVYQNYLSGIYTTSADPKIPYGFAREIVLDFLWADDCTLETVEQIELPDGQVAVRVAWEKMRLSKNKQVRYKQRGRFTFLPNASWALKDLVFLDYVKNPQTGETVEVRENIEVEYKGDHEGIPLLKSLHHWKGGSESNYPRETVEVIEITPGPVPEEEFTLAAFGIRTDPDSEPIPVIYYLLALSLACVMLAILFRALQKRSERAAASA